MRRKPCRWSQAGAVASSSGIGGPSRTSAGTPALAWIVVGIIGGFIGSMIFNQRSQGLIGDRLLGVIGAVMGAWAFGLLGATRASPASISTACSYPEHAGIPLYSMLVSGSTACWYPARRDRSRARVPRAPGYPRPRLRGADASRRSEIKGPTTSGAVGFFS